MISQILFLKQVFMKHDIMTFLKPWLVIRHEAWTRHLLLSRPALLKLSYRDQLGWKSIHITLLSDSWWFSVTLIKLLSDISKLSYIRDTFVPWIKEYYDEGYGKDVVLGCLTDFWQRFLPVWPAICRPSSVLAPVTHQQLAARIGWAWFYQAQ